MRITAAMPRRVQLVMMNALLWYVLFTSGPFLTFEKFLGLGFSEIPLEKPRLGLREVHED